MGNTKGDRGERELRRVLGEEGFVVLRAAASGSAPGFDLPDLHVADGGYEWAIEAKYYNPTKNRYLSPEEVEALKRYSSMFRNAEPKAAVRWTDRDTTWYFADPDDLPETPTGKRTLDPDARDADYYETLDDLLDLPECVECGERIYPTTALSGVEMSDGHVHARCII